MYVSIGSRSNVSDNAAEENRARIFDANLDGSGQAYAWGNLERRRPRGLDSGTNELWMSTNERDEIGEDLPRLSAAACGFYGYRGITSEIIKIRGSMENDPEPPDSHPS